MNTRVSFSRFSWCTALLGLLFAACSPGASPTIRSVQLIPNILEVQQGASKSLNAVVFGDNSLAKTVVWSSSNPAIAQVNGSGLVTGIAAGQATITATSTVDANKKGTATVTISGPSITSIRIQPDILQLALGGRRTLVAVVEGTPGFNEAITWASDNPGIVEISSSGEVRGIAEGNTNVTATSVADPSQSASLNVSVVRLALNYIPIAATVGRPINRTADLAGGNPNFSFEVVGAALPSWITLDQINGTLSGTPPSASPNTNYSIRVTDSDGSTTTSTIRIGVNAAPAIAYPAVNSFTPGSSINLAPSNNSGGTGTKTYSITPALPTGLGFSTTTGVISGSSATIQPTSSYTVTVRDENEATVTSASFSIAIASNLSLTYTATRALTLGRPIAEGTLGNYTRTLSGSVGTVTYLLTSGTLPTGLTLGADGIISGTVSAALTGPFPRTFPLTIRATDSSTATSTSTFNLVVNAAPTLTFTQVRALTAGRPVVATNYNLTPAGGAGAFSTFTATGIATTGLAIDAATGVVSGTPSAAAVLAGTLSFPVTAQDANGAVTPSATVTFTVNPAPTLVYPAASSFTVNAASTLTPTTNAGGTGVKTYTIAAGVLPTGLTLNPATGAISGTPTVVTPGLPSPIQITATDVNGAAVTSLGFTIVINPPAP